MYSYTLRNIWPRNEKHAGVNDGREGLTDYFSRSKTLLQKFLADSRVHRQGF